MIYEKFKTFSVDFCAITLNVTYGLCSIIEAKWTYIKYVVLPFDSSQCIEVKNILKQFYNTNYILKHVNTYHIKIHVT